MKVSVCVFHTCTRERECVCELPCMSVHVPTVSVFELIFLFFRLSASVMAFLSRSSEKAGAIMLRLHCSVNL